MLIPSKLNQRQKLETDLKLLSKLSLLSAIALSQALTAHVAIAQTDDFPNKSINYIIPFPPGGPTDVAGRVMAEALGKELKQTVVVENKSGASGSIGMNQLIRSKGDGYTIASLAAPSLTAPFILAKAPYDLKTDIKPIGLAYITPLVIVVNPKTHPEIKDMKSLIEAAKQNKEGLNYTTSGVGSTAHLAVEMIRKELNIDMTHIPFRGSAPGVTALLGGEVAFMYSDLVAVLTQIKAGNLRPIAVNTDQRIEELPDTPTLKEENIQAAKASSWGGLVAPKDTPDSTIQVLSNALKVVLENEDVKSRLKAVGAYPNYSDPKTMQETIAHDSAIWSSVIEDNNLRQTN